MDRVTAPAPDATGQLLASSHTSLMHGWMPDYGPGRHRGRADAGRRLAIAALADGVAAAGGGGSAVAAAYGTHWYIVDQGLSDEPAPAALWLWIALTGLAAAVLFLGWRSARGWQRSARRWLSVPLCLLSALWCSTCGLATSPPCSPRGTSSPPARCPTRPTRPPLPRWPPRDTGRRTAAWCRW